MPPQERTLPMSRVHIPDALDVFDYWRQKNEKSGSGY